MEDLKNQALELVKKYPEKINADSLTNLLRLKLKIGLITANKLIEFLENDGAISTKDKNGKRRLFKN